MRRGQHKSIRQYRPEIIARDGSWPIHESPRLIPAAGDATIPGI